MFVNPSLASRLADNYIIKPAIVLMLRCFRESVQFKSKKRQTIFENTDQKKGEKKYEKFFIDKS